MADKRIIELDSKDAIAVDDYVPVDGQTGGTKKFLASQLGGKAEVMTEAEWEDLPDDKYTDNKVYVLTDAEPPESQLFAKVGSASLDTSADNLSDAINEHESDISTLNSNLVKAVKLSGSISVSANTAGDITIDISSLSGKTIVGHSVDSVAATSSINYITVLMPYSNTGIRVFSSVAQTVTVNMIYFYKD